MKGYWIALYKKIDTKKILKIMQKKLQNFKKLWWKTSG